MASKNGRYSYFLFIFVVVIKYVYAVNLSTYENKTLLILKEGSGLKLTELWGNESGLNDPNGNSHSMPPQALAVNGSFRSKQVNNWKEYSPEIISLSLYDDTGVEVWALFFNTTDCNFYINCWMTGERLITNTDNNITSDNATVVTNQSVKIKYFNRSVDGCTQGSAYWLLNLICYWILFIIIELIDIRDKNNRTSPSMVSIKVKGNMDLAWFGLINADTLDFPVFFLTKNGLDPHNMKYSIIYDNDRPDGSKRVVSTESKEFPFTETIRSDVIMIRNINFFVTGFSFDSHSHVISYDCYFMNSSSTCTQSQGTYLNGTKYTNAASPNGAFNADGRNYHFISEYMTCIFFVFTFPGSVFTADVSVYIKQVFFKTYPVLAFVGYYAPVQEVTTMIETTSTVDATDLSTLLNIPTTTASSTENITTALSLFTSACHCACQTVNVNMTKSELTQSIAQLKLDLLLSKKSLQKYIRSKTSADDQRFSARALGIFGGIVIACVFALIVIVDLLTLFQKIRMKTI